MNTFAKISLGGYWEMPCVCYSKDFFPFRPFQVFIKQTECKFPHCFLRVKGFPLYARIRITRALCLYKMYLFILFVSVEKINLINYDGVGVFFLFAHRM